MTYTVRTISDRKVRYQSDSIETVLGFAYGWNHGPYSYRSDPVEVVTDYLTADEPDTLSLTETERG